MVYLTASTYEVTAQLNSREKGGAPDTKNPDLYYYVSGMRRYSQNILQWNKINAKSMKLNQ